MRKLIKRPLYSGINNVITIDVVMSSLELLQHLNISKLQLRQ